MALRAYRSTIEKLRLENEMLKGELSLDERQSRMLEASSSQVLFQAAEKDALLVARRIEELKTKAAVSVPALTLIRIFCIMPIARAVALAGSGRTARGVV